MAAAVKICVGGCSSKFQDLRYGLGKRVFTDGKGGMTCTVCGRKSG